MEYFGEGVKKLLLLGIGAAAKGVEKAEGIIDDLIQRGEITFEQGKILNEELKRQRPLAKEEAEKKVKSKPSAESSQ